MIFDFRDWPLVQECFGTCDPQCDPQSLSLGHGRRRRGVERRIWVQMSSRLLKKKAAGHGNEDGVLPEYIWLMINLILSKVMLSFEHV